MYNYKYTQILDESVTPSTTINNEVFMMQNEQHPQLTPAAEFERSGRCPVNLRWLIFHQKESLEEEGAIIRFGKRRWLVDEDKFISWIRANGSSFSTPKKSKLIS
jgi:hypothetical protein